MAAVPCRRNSLFIRQGSKHSGLMKSVVDINKDYNILKKLGTGRFGLLHLAEHKESKTRIALKIFPKATVKQNDFLREYNYSYFLSPHPNIVDTYDGTFTTGDSYFFVQECCQGGSLKEAVEASGNGLNEEEVKRIFGQVIAALEYMHGENLVHRNLKAENVLLFDAKTYSKVKIADFCLTRKEDTTVKHLDVTNAYHAPELCETLMKETYVVDKSVDVWALGILIYYALRAKFPWTKATIMCKPYWEWGEWLKRKNPQLPPRWIRFTEKALKLFKRSLNPKPKERATMKEIKKLTKDRWIKEIKSMSEDDLCTTEDGSERMHHTKSLSVSVPRQEETGERASGKRRSVLHQWIASTLSTMSEISEQMVSATED